jgi:hypothetical protein
VCVWCGCYKHLSHGVGEWRDDENNISRAITRCIYYIIHRIPPRVSSSRVFIIFFRPFAVKSTTRKCRCGGFYTCHHRNTTTQYYYYIYIHRRTAAALRASCHFSSAAAFARDVAEQQLYKTIYHKVSRGPTKVAVAYIFYIYIYYRYYIPYNIIYICLQG